MRRRFWIPLGGVVVALAVAAVLFEVLGGSGRPAAQPRARIYRDVTVCLLTDAHGRSGSQAAQVWAGMQDASLAAHTQATSLAVVGPATVANALPYVNTLLQQRCAVVLAAGAVQSAAVEQVAAGSPKVRFVVTDGEATGANVTAVAPSGDLRAEVTHLVRTLVH
ncbi:BMP family ABC transporter substrate-binding protein [Streptacidiphilus sp. N1-12]|uniref:BMP family ABC transporter substrate-binding protein n=2 Tax=Streptacidiphilus alkalitolerans TaxID=3342712 RepID=A0ABV6WGK1_9ACTN